MDGGIYQANKDWVYQTNPKRFNAFKIASCAFWSYILQRSTKFQVCTSLSHLLNVNEQEKQVNSRDKTTNYLLDYLLSIAKECARYLEHHGE